MAEEIRKRFALEQFHQQQRALNYLGLLQASLHTVDADYRRIVSDFKALEGAVEAITAAGKRLEETYAKPGRIEAPKRVATRTRQIDPAAWGGEVSPVPIKVVADDVVIPIRRLP